MGPPVFIGDEVTAAGFRLAGARVVVPETAAVPEVFERARAEAELVLITAGCARILPAQTLTPALHALHPLVLIVADARDAVPVPDLEAHVRRVLGLET